MKIAAQRKMKPSGVDWIGDVPEGWGVVPIKYLTSCNDEVLPENTDSYYEFDYVEIGDVKYESGIGSVERIIFGDAPSRARRVVRAGDVIISTVRTYLKAVASIEEFEFPLIVSTGFAVLRAIDVYYRYLYYAMLSKDFQSQVTLYSKGVSYPAITSNSLLHIPMRVPPLDEQKRIAAKLDRLCGRVDELAENLKGEIAALQEYRKSLITECVTKGLNPKAKMKPSGVDWIGKIPVGWTVMRLKYTGWYRNGLTYKPENVCADGEGYLVLRSSNIQQGRLDFCDTVYVDVEVPRELKVRVDDIIICSRNGSSDLIGKNAIVDVELDMTFGAFMMGYRPDAFRARYAYWLLNSHVFKYYLSSYATSTVNQLTGMDFGNMKVPLPSIDEQKRIAAFLDKQCAAIDAKIAERQRQLEKLGEYRSSVIYEYVTGKREVSA